MICHHCDYLAANPETVLKLIAVARAAKQYTSIMTRTAYREPLYKALEAIR